jgi:hypothetical protein
MALKADRQIWVDSIEYFWAATAERGGVACQKVVGSSGVTGAGLDSALRIAEYASNPSGLLAVGMLMWDAVNVDLSRLEPNRYKSEFQIGGKAFIMTKGRAVTNFFLPNALPSGGMTFPATLYLGGDGKVGVGAGLAASGYPVVGRALTALDSDGYAEVQIDL